MNKYVDVEGLNLRKTPEIESDNRLTVLHLGQQVEVINEDSLGWTEVRVTADRKQQGFLKTVLTAQPETGFLEQRSLREPVSDEKEILVAEAVHQWVRFEFGQAQEHEDPYYKHVGEMWKSIGLDLDGRDRDVPWSAAAISFMVKRAAKKVSKYKNFKGSPAHWRYIHRSISQRHDAVKAAAFWGYRLHGY